jgi:hypothetical protein
MVAPMFRRLYGRAKMEGPIRFVGNAQQDNTTALKNAKQVKGFRARK